MLLFSFRFDFHRNLEVLNKIRLQKNKIVVTSAGGENKLIGTNSLKNRSLKKRFFFLFSLAERLWRICRNTVERKKKSPCENTRHLNRRLSFGAVFGVCYLASLPNLGPNSFIFFIQIEIHCLHLRRKSLS